VAGIVPLSWAWQNSWRVSWKWSFYYLRSASPSKLVCPYTEAQPSMKKTNCPHSLLYCTPNPHLSSPGSPPTREDPAEAEAQRDESSQVSLCPAGASGAACDSNWAVPEIFPGQEWREGEEADDCVFPVIAMGRGKENRLICLMNYASPLRAALPALNPYYHIAWIQPPLPFSPGKRLSNKYQWSLWCLIARTISQNALGKLTELLKCALYEIKINTHVTGVIHQ
jgi:hypothetical protein